MVFYAIWRAIYNGENIFAGIAYEQIITYMILARLLYHLCSWGINAEISKIIKNGDIIVELIRPIRFGMQKYFFRLGKFIIEITTWVFPIFIISILLGFIQMPQIEILGLFIIAVFGAITIAYLIELIVGILVFYTTSAWGLQCFKQAIMSLFSGALIPIEVMPVALQNISNMLPFKSIIYFPVTVFLGNLSINEILQGFSFQFLWIAILVIIASFIYKMAIRKITVAGG